MRVRKLKKVRARIELSSKPRKIIIKPSKGRWYDLMIHIGRVLDRERGIALSKEEAIDLHKKLGDYLQI